MSETLDMTEANAPRSDQANAEDFLTGPRTFTIASAHKTGSAEQPFAFVLAEFPHDRPFKPSKTVRRIMVAAWGSDASAYVGKRLTLYRDPTVKFGGMDVGGIRVSHMSGIDKPLKVALAVTKGKRAMYVVDPLPDAPAPTERAATNAELFALLTKAGHKDKADALAYLSVETNRTIASLDDLKPDERTHVVAALTSLAAQPTEPEPMFDEEPPA